LDAVGSVGRAVVAGYPGADPDRGEAGGCVAAVVGGDRPGREVRAGVAGGLVERGEEAVSGTAGLDGGRLMQVPGPA